MRILPSTTAALVTSLVGVSTPSLASPAMSWSSNDVDYAQDVCMQRANRAFCARGLGKHPSRRKSGSRYCGTKGAVGRRHSLP
jgi:hypothetical protein